MNMTKRLLIGASVALAATLGSTMAGAQSYPTKPITVITVSYTHLTLPTNREV